MVNVDAVQQYEQDDVIGGGDFHFEQEQLNDMILLRIDEFITYLDMEELYEPNRFAAAINFYQYLDETENVWKDEIDIVEDIIRVSNTYLNKIWFNAGQIATNEGAEFLNETHIRGRLSRDLFQSILYFMDRNM